MSQGVVHLVVNSYTVGLSGLALPFADEGIIDYMTTFNGHLSFRHWKMSLDCDRAQLITDMAEVIKCYQEGYSSSNTSFLVFIYVGHAKDDCIVMKDGDRINFYDIVTHYANGLSSARKIFIFDGCRDTLTVMTPPKHPNCIFLYSALPCQSAHWGIERGRYGIGSYFLNQELRTNVGNLETVVGTVNEKLKKQYGSVQAFQYINNNATPVTLYTPKECTEIDNDVLKKELQYTTTYMKKYREENPIIVREHLKSRGKTVELIKGVALDLRKEEQRNTQTSSQWLTCIKADQDDLSDGCCWSQPLCGETDAKKSLYLVQPERHDSRLDCLLLTDPSSVCRVITGNSCTIQEVQEVLDNITQLPKAKRKPVVLLPEAYKKSVASKKYACAFTTVADIQNVDNPDTMQPEVFFNRSPTPYELPHSIDRFCQSLKNLMQDYEVAVSYSTLKKCEGFSDEALRILHFLGVVYYSESPVEGNSAVFVKPEVLYNALLKAADDKVEIDVYTFYNKLLSATSEIDYKWFEEFMIKLGLAFGFTGNECPILMTLPEEREREEGVNTLEPLYISDVDTSGHPVTRNHFWQFIRGFKKFLMKKCSKKNAVRIISYGASDVKLRYSASIHINIYLLSEEGFIEIGVVMHPVQSIANPQHETSDEEKLMTLCRRCEDILGAVREANFQCEKFKCNDHYCPGKWCSYVGDDTFETLECDGKPRKQHPPSARQFCWYRTPPVDQVELSMQGNVVIVKN